MARDLSEYKTFNMRMDKELWLFLKSEAAIRERSMTDIICSLIEDYKKKNKNRLTYNDTNV